MNADDFDRLISALRTLAAIDRQPVGQWIKVKPTPEHTKNLFGPLDEIAGKTLRLVEVNRQGDCLCVFEGKAGTNLVDVDHRDLDRLQNCREAGQ